MTRLPLSTTVRDRRVAALVLSAPAEGPLDWAAVFGRRAPLYVEIGPGKGVFLARLAEAHPEVDFVAIELRIQRALLCARKLAAAGSTNARLLEGRAEVRLATLFGPASVATWYVNFPDPWPKRRHRHRRLIQPAFVDLLASRSEPGATLYLATDDADYAAQMLAVCEASPDWTNALGPGRTSDAGGPHSATIHEEKFRSWGRSITYLRFERQPAPISPR